MANLMHPAAVAVGMYIKNCKSQFMSFIYAWGFRIFTVKISLMSQYPCTSVHQKMKSFGKSKEVKNVKSQQFLVGLTGKFS